MTMCIYIYIYEGILRLRPAGDGALHLKGGGTAWRWKRQVLDQILNVCRTETH